MSYINVGKENSRAIELHYQDYGKGKPVVLIHGYPLSSSAWEKQIPGLVQMGYRVIAYDRRGFGESTKPYSGYDYDTFAQDLNKVMETLDLREATLIGHSMGSGEIARYLSTYGSSRVQKAVFVSPLQPFLLKTDDNPDGLGKEMFDQFQKAVSDDRFAFLKTFFGNFYASGMVGHNGVSNELLAANMAVGSHASAKAMYDCIPAWLTDFRDDIPKITVPSLIIQGTGDKVLPFEITGKKLSSKLKNSQLVPIEGAPHGLLWTHAEEVNQAIARFLG
jgi:non-heme chloroperoxidase